MVISHFDSCNIGNLIQIINDEIDRRSLLNHRFYILWKEGKLTLNHLSSYSKEYFQLVKAVPQLVHKIQRNLQNSDCGIDYLQSVKNTQAEEYQHIEPWINFAHHLGVEKKELLDYEGNDEVNLAIENLKDLCNSSIYEGASAMYSFEKELPLISKTKIEGLTTFYNISTEEAIKYFKIHQIADIEHARLWKTIFLDSKLVGNTKVVNENIRNASISSMKSQNQLLDAIYNNYVKDTIACN